MSPRRRSALVYLAGLGALVLVAFGVITLDARRKSQAQADAQVREETVRRGPRVRLAEVKRSSGVRHLVLQGEARPYAEVTLYAKVAGYLRDLRVDKGDRVKANQVLATVIAPELDAQYLAAEADARNKRVNAKRLTALAPSGVVSAQELEQGQAAADVAEATQAALSNQRDYRVIRAPFSGVVTARFADPGTLIQSAANAQSGAVPIVSVAKGDTLRVYVYLDQASASFVRVGRRRDDPRARAARLVAPGEGDPLLWRAVTQDAHHADRGRHRERRRRDPARQLRRRGAGREGARAAGDPGRGAGDARREDGCRGRRRREPRALPPGGGGRR